MMIENIQLIEMGHDHPCSASQAAADGKDHLDGKEPSAREQAGQDSGRQDRRIHGHEERGPLAVTKGPRWIG